MADHRKVARQALVAIDPRFNADPPVSSIAGARGRASSSLLKNLEMESFRILAGRCWGGAVELDVIF
jgi:hypothetical protein